MRLALDGSFGLLLYTKRQGTHHQADDKQANKCNYVLGITHCKGKVRGYHEEIKRKHAQNCHE